MLELSCANSGEERYLLNSLSQASWLPGHSEPVTGRHSVILSLPRSAGAFLAQLFHLPGLCEARQAAEDDDAEDARSAPQQPVCDALGRYIGVALRPAALAIDRIRQYRGLCIGGPNGGTTPQRLGRLPTHRLRGRVPGGTRSGRGEERSDRQAGIETRCAHEQASREARGSGAQLRECVEDGRHGGEVGDRAMVVAAVTFLVARLALRGAVIGGAAGVSAPSLCGTLASGASRICITRATTAKIPCAPSSASFAA
jgi:hypothetical protein